MRPFTMTITKRFSGYCQVAVGAKQAFLGMGCERKIIGVLVVAGDAQFLNAVCFNFCGVWVMAAYTCQLFLSMFA